MTVATDFSSYLEIQQDFPRPGVTFVDFTPLHANPAVFTSAIATLNERLADVDVDAVAAIEAKGFIVGTAMAMVRHRPLVLIRKPGLTPGAFSARSFVKEYGEGAYELKAGRLRRSDRVLVVYDILAAPGAARAAIDLVEDAGATVAACAFIVELAYLDARRSLSGYRLESLISLSARPRS